MCEIFTSSGYANPKGSVSGYATPFLTSVGHGVDDLEMLMIVVPKPLPSRNYLTKVLNCLA
jgi:hypothetical protein